jgi:hypothetical protein
MLGISFFKWWYGKGWSQVISSTKRRLRKLSETFSIKTLLITLFAPWRRIITYPGASIKAHMQALVDNIVSRVIGFLIRICVLIAAAIVLFFTLIFSVVEFIVWPLIPLATVSGIVIGLWP